MLHLGKFHQNMKSNCNEVRKTKSLPERKRKAKAKVVHVFIAFVYVLRYAWIIM